MSALELISLTNQLLFVGLFVAAIVHAVRRPSRAALDTVLLFGSIAIAVMLARLAGWFGLGGPWMTGAVLALVSVAPWAMLRLVDDFSGTPRWVQWAGTLALAGVIAVSLVLIPSTAPLLEIVIGWFLVVGGYATFAFMREAQRTRGITRRRMTAVAVGAVSFIGAVVLVFAEALLVTGVLGIAGQLLALAAGLAFFLGFAPPAWIRRAWREPDLRRFLERSIHLAGLDDERRAVLELQQAAASALGATGAGIGLAGPGPGTLRYLDPSGAWAEYPDDAFIGGQAFQAQRRVVALDAAAVDPDHAADYQLNAATTVIAAPITTEDRKVGVLTVFADRAPVFVEDDLWLLELLANQVAVILDARALSAEAASLRSREDAARLKEEFLSAAAHDLRTPLTVVLGQSELLERRVARDPTAPADAAGVARIAREARRLRDLVSQLLDAQRLEQGASPIERRPTDLRDVLSAVEARSRDHGLDVKVVRPDEPLVGSVDRLRIEQVLDNLLENALKYTSNGRMPELHLSSVGNEARVSVVDHGVGIPEGERERIFERFYRASNVHSITDTGMGLGLYICRRIVDAHGGRIWVEPTPGGGSTFVVTIPAEATPPSPDAETSQAWRGLYGSEVVADA